MSTKRYPPPRRYSDCTPPYLEHSISVSVRFQEVDSMRVVWHGWYISYFEDARVALGRRFGISYEDIVAQGLMAPLVHISCDYYSPARYGSDLTVTARLYPKSSAKLEHRYIVEYGSSRTLLAMGRSVQVFTDLTGELILAQPAWFRSLKQDWQQHLIHDEP